MIDRFTLEDFDNKRISRFEIQYLNEIIYDDEISVLKQDLSESEYVLEIKNSEGVSCCKSKCLFTTI